MAFNLTLCPFCGRDLDADGISFFVCESCGKRIYRARSALTAFLDRKPYGEEYEEIIEGAEHNPSKAFEHVNEIFDNTEEPDIDLYFTRAIIYTFAGEEGKARADWKKGLENIKDIKNIDAYIISACRCITEIIISREREFIDFNYKQFIGDVASDFAQAANISCKGIFYITVFRNFKIKFLAGDFADDDDLYQAVVKTLCSKIIPYGRNHKTVVSIITDILQDSEYDRETYEDDDNLVLHAYDLVQMYLKGYSENFSDNHNLAIFDHWSDESMSELDYIFGRIIESTSDSSALVSLSQLFHAQGEEIDIGKAVEDYVQKYLLIEPQDDTVSENPEM